MSSKSYMFNAWAVYKWYIYLFIFDSAFRLMYLPMCSRSYTFFKIFVCLCINVDCCGLNKSVLYLRLYFYGSIFFQPPIQVYGVEGRYATALFSAASKQKSLDKVEQELGRVSVSFPVNISFRFYFLHNAWISSHIQYSFPHFLEPN